MKKILKMIIGFILLILLVPIKVQYKDGGTGAYQATIYTVYDVHAIYEVSGESGEDSTYAEGYIVKIFGHEVFNNTEPHIEF